MEDRFGIIFIRFLLLSQKKTNECVHMHVVVQCETDGEHMIIAQSLQAAIVWCIVDSLQQLIMRFFHCCV
jgi:hypothetical protein